MRRKGLRFEWYKGHYTPLTITQKFENCQSTSLSHAERGQPERERLGEGTGAHLSFVAP
jgi:hypothetical protein